MTPIDTTLFSAASSSEMVASAAGGAKSLAMATWPFWGLPLALILLTVFIGVVIWMISKAKHATPGKK